ncbi:MAG: hypothetical protein ACQEQ8_05005 [Pseudomonadota bacterium]
MNQQRKQMYIRFNQGRYSASGGPGQPGGGPGGNWLSKILSLFLLLVMVGLAITFGVFILMIGVILMIPVLWKQRHAIRQFWQLRKQAKAQFEETKNRYKEEQQQSYDREDNTVIDGEYEEVDESKKK